MLYVYNTFTKKKEEFKPINPPEVRMYTCGPTVYDYFHIGNARSFIMSDIIRRYLIYSGYTVRFIMNLTDVDDKIIKKANIEKIDSSLVAEKFSAAFLEDITKLKVMPADLYPKATSHMNHIIEMIKRLEDSGFAYNIEGNVFYDVSKFKNYGKLSGKKTDELESGARIEINEEKRNPLDFSLWKKGKEGEPYWESPWGKGRPGWHIECSAMSCAHLGETFDIHAGGNDLIFPHHENEIAQSEAANQQKFVNYWLHFGFLNINEEKMSKSLGNFFTARDILKKYSAEAIRLFFAQAHYAGPLNFSEELLESAQKGLEKISNLKFLVTEKMHSTDTASNIHFNFSKYESCFREAMDDNFNTPQAVAIVFDFVKDVNKTFIEYPGAGKEFFSNVKEYLKKTAGEVLGIIDFNKEADSLNGKLENNLIELLIDLRTKAKKEKNYEIADDIRNKLLSLGIELKDGKDKTSFRKSLNNSANTKD